MTPRALLLSLATILGAAAPATAGVFTVSPTRVFLSARATSALVTVQNQGAAAVRLQVKAHAWSQSPSGHIQLSETDELIVFPSLLTLAPGEQRRIRVATAIRASETERSFRMFVEELPPEERAGPGVPSVQMLTRMGIPVFVQPPKPQARAGVRDLGVANGVLRFTVDNLGNTFFIPDAVRVVALDAQGGRVLDQSVDGWYILAGGTRQFELPVAAPACGAVRQFTVDVRIGDMVLKEHLQAPLGACAGGRPVER